MVARPLAVPEIQCTPAQIMMYQLAINLFKMVNLNLSTIRPSNDLIRILDQVVITRRQVMFELYRTNRSKIGMNAIENKLYHLNKLIATDKLGWNFPRFKKHMKIQFLKYGNT